MKVVKWTPLSNRMMPHFDDMFEDFAGPMMAHSMAPAIDVYEEDNNVVAEAPLPGIDPEQLNISIENDVLSIEGSSEKKTEVDDKNYYRKEVRYGSFHRAIALPCSVDGDKAEAEYDDGVLKIVIPKAAAAKKKSIKVKNKKK